MMFKKLAAAALCAALLTVSAYAAADWPDWASQAEDWAVEKEFSPVFLDSPHAEVSRGQAAQLIYEAEGRPAVSEDAPFSDVPEAYDDAVSWAYRTGYVDGVAEDVYDTDRAVERQEFALMLYRGAGKPDVSEYSLSGFTDAGQVEAWARDAMTWCVGVGLMDGKAEGMLVPEDTITVAEAVTMLLRVEGMDSERQTVAVSDLDEIKQALSDAIDAVEQPPLFDVSELSGSQSLEIDVINLYNALLSEHPEYKYAYDMKTGLGGGTLTCTISYMPYRAGYPAGFEGVEVDSLRALINTAEENLSSDSVNIRITNRGLTVDEMNRALQQAGGSYILCQLSDDGTAITFTPLNGLSRAESLEKLSEIESLAGQLVSELINDGMSETEKAEALYTWLTENVKYDHRYYSDRTSMPYDYQTAYGALHDGLAICGGYAQALQALFEQAGITCYNVSGSMGSEYHMWNIAFVDGQWRYFDATSDRGRADYWFNYFNVGADALERYTWDEDFLRTLTGTE